MHTAVIFRANRSDNEEFDSVTTIAARVGGSETVAFRTLTMGLLSPVMGDGVRVVIYVPEDIAVDGQFFNATFQCEENIWYEPLGDLHLRRIVGFLDGQVISDSSPVFYPQEPTRSDDPRTRHVGVDYGSGSYIGRWAGGGPPPHHIPRLSEASQLTNPVGSLGLDFAELERGAVALSPILEDSDLEIDLDDLNPDLERNQGPDFEDFATLEQQIREALNEFVGQPLTYTLYDEIDNCLRDTFDLMLISTVDEVRQGIIVVDYALPEDVDETGELFGIAKVTSPRIPTKPLTTGRRKIIIMGDE